MERGIEMGTQLRKWSLLLVAAAICAIPLPSWAQVTSAQLKDWLNSPQSASHVGNITGNAKAAAAPYRRYCVGCHGNLGDGEGENATWMESPMYPKPRNF